MHSLLPPVRNGNLKDSMPAVIDSRLAKALRSAVGGDVLFDAYSRGRYATDASFYQIMPVGVFVPSCDEDIAVALQVAQGSVLDDVAQGSLHGSLVESLRRQRILIQLEAHGGGDRNPQVEDVQALRTRPAHRLV